MADGRRQAGSGKARIRASHIKGQTLVEMAGTHHRSHIMENVTLTPKEQSRLQVLNRPGSRAHDLG